MKTAKKLLTLALAALMLLSLAVPAMADDSDFVIENGVLTKYNGPGGAVTIPNSVTSIGRFAFVNCDNLTSVTIPSSVTDIGDAAFNSCIGLTNVTISNGVTSIKTGAFSFCTSLASVTIPNSVTSFGDGVFQGCGGLTSVTIPNSVTSIGHVAFEYCTSLTDVYFGGTQAQWEALQFDEFGSPAGTFAIDDFGGVINPTIHYNSTGPDASTTPTTPEPAASESAMPTNDQLTVNGALQSPTVYKIDGSNYFKIRDLAAMLNGSEKQFDVGYDGALKSVTLTTGKGYAKLDTDMAGAASGGNQAATPSNDSIYIDGQKIDVTVYKIGGNNYFKLRDLGKALGFYVGWTAEDGVFIDTSKPYSD